MLAAPYTQYCGFLSSASTTSVSTKWSPSGVDVSALLAMASSSVWSSRADPRRPTFFRKVEERRGRG